MLVSYISRICHTNKVIIVPKPNQSSQALLQHKTENWTLKMESFILAVA